MLSDELKVVTGKAKAKQEEQRKLDLAQAQATAEAEVAEALPKIKEELLKRAQEGHTNHKVSGTCFKMTDAHHFLHALRKHVPVFWSEGNLEFDWSEQ